MKCPIETREHNELLLAYCCEKLDQVEAAALKTHIEGCPACQEFTLQQSAVLDALDEWKPAPVSANFDRKLYARIEKEVSWWDVLVRPFRPLAARQGLPIAAAAAVLIVAGILVDRPVGTVTQVTPPKTIQVQSGGVSAEQM